MAESSVMSSTQEPSKNQYDSVDTLAYFGSDTTWSYKIRRRNLSFFLPTNSIQNPLKAAFL